MKYILELILATIIIFFLWNILKRLFFSAFYKFPKPQNNENVTTQKTKKNLESKRNWEAETGDKEKVKDEKTSER